MTEITVFTRRNGGRETRGGERFDGPACVAGRLAWPDSNGYTNPIGTQPGSRIRSIRSRASLRDARRTAFAPRAARFGLPRSSPFVSVAPFLRVETVRSATSVTSASASRRSSMDSAASRGGQPRPLFVSDCGARGLQDRVRRRREPATLREFRLAAAASAELFDERGQHLLRLDADIRGTRDDRQRRRG